MSLRTALPVLRFGAVALAVAAFPLVAALGEAPAQGPVAAVFPPHWDRARLARAVAEADAALVRFAPAPGLVVAAPGPEGRSALRAAGAVMFLDPVVAGGCSPDPARVSALRRTSA